MAGVAGIGATLGVADITKRAMESSSAMGKLRIAVKAGTGEMVSQAEVQTTIRQLLTAFGPKLSTDARPPAQVTGQPGVWRLPVTIRGVLTQAQLTSILSRVESSDRLLVIDELTIGFVERMPTITMTITAYYRVDAPRGNDNARP